MFLIAVLYLYKMMHRKVVHCILPRALTCNSMRPETLWTHVRFIFQWFDSLLNSNWKFWGSGPHLDVCFVRLPFNSLRNVSAAMRWSPAHVPSPYCFSEPWSEFKVPGPSFCQLRALASRDCLAHLLTCQKLQRTINLQEKPPTSGWWKLVYKTPAPLPLGGMTLQSVLHIVSQNSPVGLRPSHP